MAGFMIYYLSYHPMRRRGFTIVELIVVLSLIGVVFIVTMVAWSGLSTRALSEEIEQEIVSLIQLAREKTLSRQNGASYGVHFTSSTVTVFPGSTFADGATSNTAYALPANFEIGVTNLRGGGVDIFFLPFSGTTNQDGAVRLDHTTSDITRTITIYASGYVES